MLRRVVLLAFPSPAAIGALITAFCVAAWVAWGEPWELLYDASHYLAVARGELAEAPFAYRPLAPALARSLTGLTGWGLPAAFGVVLWASLVGTGAVLAAWTRDRTRGAVVAAFWGLSYPVAFGATVAVAADPLFLFALIAAAWLASTATRRPAQGVAVAILVVLGVLAHEMALFALVVVGARKLVGARAPLTPGGAPTLRWAALASAGALGVFAVALVHAWTPTATVASVPSWTDHSPLALARWVVDYGGGPLRYPLRVYAAFGPAAVFALAALPERRLGERIADVGLVAAAVALTFLATDTLRVMSLAAVVVLPLAARFVVSLAERGHARTATLALALQALYALIVYGHLRTFEGSMALQGAAAVGSLAALVLVVGSWWLPVEATEPPSAQRPARAAL